MGIKNAKAMIRSTKLKISLEYWGIKEDMYVDIGKLKGLITSYCDIFGHIKIDITVAGEHSHTSLFVKEGDTITELPLTGRI